MKKYDSTSNIYFVENKSGTLLRVLDLFKEAGVQLIASTISDTVEYGIYRISVPNPRGHASVAGGRHFGQHVGSVCHHVGQPSRRAADAVRVITGEG